MARSASPARTRSRVASRPAEGRGRGTATPTRPTKPARRKPTASARRRRARARRRRALVFAAIALVPVVALGVMVLAFYGALTRDRALTPLTDPPAFTLDGTPGEVTYDAEQRENAATIMIAGRDLGLSVRDQAIGVMTAMGESSLRNLDYGDWETSGVTNPDGSPTTSIGLFQQQDGWGTREQRLDPYTAATLFYRAMLARVPDRDALAPTLVAHRTQVNQDPDHYAPYWPRAIALIEELSGADSGLDP